jgi:gliding motility-associated-like protein/uncharacterized repeat protein (TIGR01451 family)
MLSSFMAQAQVDVSLSSWSNAVSVSQGGTVTIRVVVHNDLKTNATGLQVGVSPGVGLNLTSSSAPGGTNFAAGTWNVGSALTAGVDSLILTLVYDVVTEGPHFVVSEVIAVNEIDLDSAPADGAIAQDDYALAYVTVPYRVCAATGDTITITAPPGYLDYQWFLDQGFGPQPITGATTQILKAYLPGWYTYTAIDPVSKCGASLCCPIILDEKCFDLALFKKLANGQPEMVEPGDIVTFTISIINQGDVIADNILISDYIPAQLSFVAQPGWSSAASIATRTLNGGDELPIGGLLPGETVNIDIQLQVNSPLAVNTVITNWAEITSATDEKGDVQPDIDSYPDNDPDNDNYLVDNLVNDNGKAGGDEDDHDPAQVIVEPFDLALFKQLANGQSAQVAPGEDVTFTITVVNQGLIAAGNIDLADYFNPAQLTLNDPNWSADGAGRISLNSLLGPLAPGASIAVDVTFTLASPLASNTIITNWAEISAATDDLGNPQVDFDSNPDNNNNDLFLVDDEITGNGKSGGDEDDHDKAELVILPFDLALFKTLGVGQNELVEAGDKVTFTISVVNQGSITAGNIELTDYVPANMTFIGADNPGWSFAAGKATRTLPGTLAPGSTASANIVLQVNSPLASNTVITNWAEISAATDGAGNPQEDIDSNPDDTDNDLYLADNEINGDGKNGGDEDDHDPASVTVLPFDLALYKTLANGQSSQVKPGEKVNFTINVVNQGLVSASNIEVVDYVPAGMTFVLADNPGWAASGPNFVRTLPGTLAPGATTSTNVILTVNNPLAANTTLVNWAEIASATDDSGNPQVDIDSNPDETNNDLFLSDNEINGDGKNGGDEDDHDKAEVVVDPFDLALFKQLANGQPHQVAAGDDVTFSITVVNQGLITATDIEITDYVPSNFTFIGANNPGWTIAAGKATRTIAGPLAPGSSTSIDIVLRVNSPLASNTIITNWAEISDAKDQNGVSQPDIDSTPDDANNDLFLVDDYIDGDGKNGGDEDDHDKAEVIVLPFDLALIKTLAIGQPSNVAAGDKVTFTITVYNQGAVAAGNIELVDYIPSDMTFVGADNPTWSLTGNKASTTLPGTLAPGASTTTNIVLTVNAPLAANTIITNWAEIAAATDDNGDPQIDIDSNPDDINNDTYLQDNEIAGNGKNGEDEDDHDQAQVVIDPFDLALFKTLSAGQSSTVKPGDKVSFTIHVINQGAVPAANIEVTDYVSTDFTFVGGDNPGWAFAAGKATRTLGGILAPGATTTTTIILTANNPLAANTTIYNWAEISSATDDFGNPQEDIDSNPDDVNNDLFLIDDYVDGNGKNGGDEDDHDRALVVVDRFDLALYKQRAPGQAELVAAGDNVTFRIAVVNQGNITATQIEITDYVPSNMTFEAGSNPLWSFAAGKANRVLAGPLAPGATMFADIVLRANAPLASNTVLVNWAEISEARDLNNVIQPDIDSDADDVNNDLYLVDDYIDGDGKNGGDEDDHDRAHVTILPFDLALDKVLAPGQSANVTPGDKVSFAIRVYNQGLVAANNIELTDYVPAGLTFVPADNPTWTFSAGKATTTITSVLAPGGLTSRTLILTVNNPLPAGTTLQNWAEISAATDASGNPQVDIDSNPDDANDDTYVTNNDIQGDGKSGEDEDDHDQETVVVQRFDLALTKTLSPGQLQEVTPGQNVSFQITVYNQGEYDAYNVEVSDYNPTCLLFNALSNPGWSLVGGLPTYTIPGPIAPGSSATVTIILQADAPKLGETEIWNWAEISDAQDNDGVSQIDDDSTPNTDPDDDNYLQDNEINGDGKAGEDEDDHDPALIIIRKFDLALYKQLAPGENMSVEPGDTRIFNIFVVNQGQIPADNILVTDYIPVGMTLMDMSWSIAGQLATRTLTAGNELPVGGLLPGQTAVVTIALQVPNPIAESTKLVNWAEISDATDNFGFPMEDYDSTPDQDVSNDKFLIDNYIGGDAKNGGDDEDDHDQAYVMYRVYDLALRKTVDNDCPVRPGDTIEYTITVFNQGTEAVQDVVLVDSIASGLIFNQNIQLFGWHLDGTPNRVTFEIDDPIAPGDSSKVKLFYIIKPGCLYYNDLWNFAEIVHFDDLFGTLKDTADIDSSPDKNFWNDNVINDIIDNDGSLDEDDHDIQIPPIFDLAIRMIEQVNLPVKIGQDVPYEITVFNQGNITAQNIDLKQFLPFGFVLSPNDADGWSDIGNLMAEVTVPGPLVPGDSVKVQILLRVTEGAHEGDLMNYVEIQGAEDLNGKDMTPFDFDSDPDMDKLNDLLTNDVIDKCKQIEEDDNDKATVELFDLALRKTPYERQRVQWGDDVTFTITVFNQSPLLSAKDIALVDYLPTGFALSPLDANGWTNAAPGQITKTLAGPIVPGDSLKVDVTLRVQIGAPGGNTDNFAEITGAFDTDGRDLTNYDFDSHPDNDKDNDVVEDNEINEHDQGTQDEDDHDLAPIFVEIFDLALRKTTNQTEPVLYGNNVTFTITVFNQGNVPATDIEVRDYMPSGFKMKFANLNGWVQNASNLTYKLAGPVLPGDSVKVNIILTVEEEASPYGLSNLAEIIKAKNELGQDRTGDDIDSWNDSNPLNDILEDDVITEQAKLNPGDEEDDHDIATVYMFDLALRKTTPVKKPVTVGNDVLFTIEVFNQGTVTAQNIAVIDHIPAGFILSPVEADWTDMGNGTATAVLAGPILPGESDTLDIILRVAQNATAGFFTNLAEITFAEDDKGIDRTNFDVDSDPDTNKNNDPYVDDEINDNGDFDEDDHDGATIEVEIIDLALKKIIQFKDMAPVKIGEDVSFAIEVFNQGSVTMYDIGIIDYIPAGFDLSPTDGNLWTVVGNKAYNSIAGPLLPGQKRSFGIVLRVNGNASVQNLINGAEIISAKDPNGDERAQDDRDSDPDENPDNDDFVNDEILQTPPVDEDDHDYEGVPVFDLALRKTPNFTGKVTVGDDLDFTVTVFNQGNIIAENIELVDYIPTGLALSPNDVNGWAVSGSQATNALAGPILPGDSAKVIITLRVLPAATAGFKVNTAEITAAENDKGVDLSDRDLDSTPDDIVNNDTVKDDVINENGQGGNDQDDHDIASFEVEIFDLALRKTLHSSNQVNPISIGDDVIFEIEVFNQGSVTMKDIELVDYYPPGFGLSPNDANGWIDNGNGTASTVFPYALPPGQSATVGIVLKLNAKTVLGYVCNAAEITYMEDNNGVDRSQKDRDSSPDSNPDNDVVIDDEIFKSSPDDEDDHDIAKVFVDGFDLALTKTVATNQVYPIVPGSPVLFKVNVYNQGTYDAYNVKVSDYVPFGLEIIDPSWSLVGNLASLITPVPFIAAGDSITIDLQTKVADDYMGFSLLNRAEISEADDNNNPGDGFPEDVDSDPNTNPDDDVIGGNDVTDNSNGDEDDHDLEIIEVKQTFDLALIKTLANGQKPLVLPGDTVRFTIYVINQGTLNAYDIQVKDYVPANTTFVTALNTSLNTSNPYNWASNATYTVPGPLSPGDSTSIDILLIVDANTQLEHICNASEIAYASQTAGGPNSADEDSTPDTDADNDIYGGDNITDNTANDEDDHDESCIYLEQIFDLALIKQTAATDVKPGDKVTFTISVSNQGSQDAYDVDVVDYIPDGFIFHAADNPTWALDGLNKAVTRIDGPIAVATTQAITIILQVNPDFIGTSLANLSEIKRAAKEDGGPDTPDEDSTPNDTPDDDTIGGDDITDNSNNDEDDHDPSTVDIIQIFDLALTKTTLVVEAEPGDNVLFNIHIFNQGTTVARDVVITDYIPTGFLFDAGLNPGWTNNGNGTVSTTLAGPYYPAVTPVTVVPITLQIDPAFQGRTITNLAEISSATNTPGGAPVADEDSTPDADPDNDTIGGDDVVDNSNGDEDDHDPASILVKQRFDLALIKTTSTPVVRRNDLVDFTITVTNQGTLDAYDITVRDTYGDFEYSGAANAGWVNNGDGTASTIIAGPLAPGASTSVVISLRVPEFYDITSMTNLAEIEHASETPGGPNADDEDSTPDSDPDNDPIGGNDVTDNSNGDEDDQDPETVTVDLTFDLALVKRTTKKIAAPGELVPFVITVFNQGAVTAYDFKLRDYIPTGFKFPFGMNPFWTDGGDGTAFTTIPGPIAPGDSMNINLTLFVDTLFLGQSLTNIAEIERATDRPGGPDVDDVDSTPDRERDNDVIGGDDVTDNSNGDEDDHDPETVTIPPVYDLALIKQTAAGLVQLGDTVAFTITVFNQGNVPAHDIRVKDYIPVGFIFDFGMNANWTDNGDGTAFTYIDGPLNGGQNTTVTISLIVDKNFTGASLTNIAEIERSADQPGGPDVDDKDSTPDGDRDNDIIGGDDITDNTNDDEDDHDFTIIVFEPCTLSLKDIPADFTIECDQVQHLTNPATVKAMGGCCLPVNITLDVVSIPGAQCPQNYILIRTWTARDQCNNEVTVSQTVTVRDSKAPVFTNVPGNITVECDAIPVVPVVGVHVTAVDNCDPDVAISMTETVKPGQCKDTYEIVRTWKAKDDCGNEAFASQSVFVRDTKAPVFTNVPSDITLNCGQASPFPPVVQATDNCDTNVDVQFSEAATGSGNCAGQPAYKRTWIATDNCGNTAVHTQNIFINDKTPPVFVGVPANVTVECNAVPSAWNPIVEDACDQQPTVNFSEQFVPGNCPGNYTLIRRWEASDDCGNKSTAIQNVVVRDTKAPVITFVNPSLIGVANGDTIKAPCNNQPIYGPSDVAVVDNCDINPTIVFVDAKLSENGCSKLLFCEWTATDNCGNQSKKYFYMQVGDFVAPVLAGVPADLTLECDQTVPAPAKPTATDNCDANPKVSLQETTQPGNCPQSYVLVRTWTASDACNNSSTKSQRITVRDTKAPTFSIVNPLLNGKKSGDILNVECGNEPVLQGSDLAVTDACDPNPTVNLTSSATVGNCEQNGYFKQVTYTWQAIDACGNQSGFVIIVRVTDTQKPVFTNVPANVTINCGDTEPTNAPIATDNCDPQPDLAAASSISPLPCGYLIERSWTATDECGNKATVTQRITVTDKQAPVISGVPADITLQCGQPAPFPSGVTVSDLCDANPTLAFTEEAPQPGACAGSFVLVRKWTATDNCGNVSTKTQKITVVDNQAPVFTFVPANTTISCEQSLPGTGGATATDNCGGLVLIGSNDVTVPGACVNSYSIVRTYTASDPCGNKATATQTITVTDTKAPVFVNVPANTTIECDQILNIQKPTVTDNCDNDVTLTSTQTSVPGSCPAASTLTVTWTATDNCGNKATSTQIIQVRDTKAPIITPVDPSIVGVANGSTLTFNCNDLPILGVNAVQATDNCDNNVQVTFAETAKSGNCLTDGYYTELTCTWTATDDCGNSSTYVVYMRIADKKAPTFTFVPSNTAIECGTPEPNVLALATDNCDNSVTVTVARKETILNCGYQVVRTFTATDDCGNTATAQQVIMVNDTKSPVLSGVPADITVNVKNGQSVPAPATVTASDECQGALVVTFTEVKDEKDCGYLLIRTWKASDKCGNSTQAIQMIVVDEGCPCQEPILESLGTINPECGQTNGSITIQLVGNEADFDYTWLPAKGTANQAGNARTNLPAGTYSIIISDPASSSCFIKLTATLAVEGSCTDTVYINIPQADPYQLCVDNVLDLVGNVASATVCGFDPFAITSINLDQTSGCMVIDPTDNFVGETIICVEHCDDANPANCDKTFIVVKIDAVNEPCGDIVTNSFAEFTITACDKLADVCIELPLEAMLEFELKVNGQPYTNGIFGCDFDSTFAYTYFGVPGKGNAGPYTLNQWTVNGQTFNGSFQTIDELVVMMNTWDPAGNWILDPATYIIKGGSAAKVYSKMLITQTTTSAQAILEVNINLVPNGTSIKLGEGAHTITFNHNVTGCKDEMTVTVFCEELPEEVVAVNDQIGTIKNQAITVKVLNNDIIPNNDLGDMYILTWPIHGDVKITADHQILYTPSLDYCGLDEFQYVICNEFMCDTAKVSIDVRCIQIVINTGFSPNGDGINDNLTIQGLEAFPKNELSVFNRWGNEVFSQKGYKNNWSGTWDSGILPDGTYFYIFKDGEGMTYSGYVQLNR